ncbi:MAG TPA: GMC family oxidoreductase [Saprospiraceae bacterium]|nr:GMC family oxidoreductase [Saprospiraceae bacterium]
MVTDHKTYDAIIIGSGFGGAMMAKKLVDAGWHVAMVERGQKVIRGRHNWDRKSSLDLTRQYDFSQPYTIDKGGNKANMGTYEALGGPSIFYGGVSFRFRENDFHPPSDITADTGAKWPVDYNDLMVYYDEAESILQISGDDGPDPTAPPRFRTYPQGVSPIAKVSDRIHSAAMHLGLNPFRMPLAINYEDDTRNTCVRCTTCDTFACAIGAKNDLETMVFSQLSQNQNFEVYQNTIVAFLEFKNGRIDSIHCYDKPSSKKFTLQSKWIILSAGALGSPHLILSSGLDSINPAGKYIGRFLMRHVNAIIFGIYPTPPDKEKIFHKELAIMDYYFGHESIPYPLNKIGSLQQIATPPSGLVENEAPFLLGKIAASSVRLLTGLLAIAEDQPQFKNRIYINEKIKSIYGMPSPHIYSEYSDRDIAALHALSQKAKMILKKTGAWTQYTHHIKTFSHSVGTVRMGDNLNNAPLDRFCQFRGLKNMFVVDGSFMPTSAAVNPSLTISANALRVADYLIQNVNCLQ